MVEGCGKSILHETAYIVDLETDLVLTMLPDAVARGEGHVWKKCGQANCEYLPLCFECHVRMTW